MKNILLTLIITFTAIICHGQEIFKRSNKLTPYVTEKYTYTIGTDREIRQGLYQAFYKKKFALASGKYKDDKRVGMWHFLNRQGELIENFNYDTNTLQYESAEDSTSNIQYLFDYVPKDSDVLTKPVKPGGRYFGYLPYLRLVKLPDDIRETGYMTYDVILELLISPGGLLADYNVKLKSRWDERVYNLNIKQIHEEDKLFIPATINKNPVSVRIALHCHINEDGNIDMN